jgi:ribulose-5-phosphate 4-epimerase/fuculose-1-phosphate aldolase
MLDVMGQRDICLMRAHGILVVGKTVEEVTHKSIVLETLARLNYYAALKGNVREISDEDKEEWNRRERADIERGRSNADERNANWDYYVTLVNEPGAVQFNDVSLGMNL